MVDEKTDARVEKANVAFEKKDLLAFLRYSLLDVLQFTLDYTYKMGESDKRERPLDFYPSSRRDGMRLRVNSLSSSTIAPSDAICSIADARVVFRSFLSRRAIR